MPVTFTPGTTLTVAGSAGTDQFSFDASGSSVVVALDGEIHCFASGEFSNYVFQGDGGTASLTGSASGNIVALYTTGAGKLTNSTAGYSVNVSGMATMIAVGHAGDTAQFFDSAGKDTYYAYADYANDGKPVAGMYGTGYSNAASGFGTNIGTNLGGSAAAASDTAIFFDSPGNDTYYAFANYDKSGQTLAGMYGSFYGGYSNSAKGFGTSVGYSVNGGSDTASLMNSSNSDTLYTDAAIASLYGNDGSYAEQALGFPVVTVNGTGGGLNNRNKGPDPLKYQLNLVGTWGA